MSEILWMILQFTQGYCQPIFTSLAPLFFFLPKVGLCRMVVIDCWLSWCGHTISTSLLDGGYKVFKTGLFLVWWHLALYYFDVLFIGDAYDDYVASTFLLLRFFFNFVVNIQDSQACKQIEKANTHNSLIFDFRHIFLSFSFSITDIFIYYYCFCSYFYAKISIQPFFGAK